MALTAGQLMATLSLDMAPYEASLTRAKERARQDGAQIAMHLRVEPQMDNAGYTASLNRMVEEAKKAAARIKGEMSTIHMERLDFGAGGIANVGKVRGQLKSVSGDMDRLRRLVNAPLVLGGAEDERLKAELEKLQQQMDRLRASASRPVRMSSTGSSSSVPTESSSPGALSKMGSGVLRNVGYMAGSAAIFAVGAALVSTIKSTADFETEMNTLGAVAGPVGMAGTTIAQVSAKALALGADFTIANASASDAAVTMTELVKGGLSAAQAMDAAKGSLQLASAGGISFVQAADLESAALAQFALKGTDAGKVADILANSAHAARGTVGDLGTALTYAGLNAHQAGWSLKETATTLAEFAKFGLTGSLGGTTLKDFTMRVEKAAVSTGAAGEAYKQLGLDVYNQDGTLKSAAQISDQLATAHKKLAPMIYNSAMQTVFGARAINGANIMAMQGSKGWNELADKISKGAGAAGFSAARMQGLGGAFANLQNQVETAQIQLGEKFSPALQHIVNQIADAVPTIANFMAGPSIGTGFSHLGDFFAPLVNGAKDLVAKAMPYISDFVHSIGQGFGSIIDFIHPVITAIGDFWKKAADNGSVAAVANVFDEVGTAFKNAAKFLVPVGDAIGHVIGWVGGLGTFGTVLGTVGTAMLAFKLVSPLLASVARMVPGFSAAEGAVKSFGATYRALGSTGMGSVSAALGAAAQGAANLGKGLLAAFGGPVGLAIMGITTLIALLPQLTGGDNSAATAASNHKDAVNALADAFQTSNGQIDDNIRKTALAQLQSAKWGKESTDLTAYSSQLHTAGVSTTDLVNGMLSIPGASTKVEGAYQKQRAGLEAVRKAGTDTNNQGIETMNASAMAADANLKVLDQQHSAYQSLVGVQGDAIAKAKENADAIKSVGAAATIGSGGVKDLKTNTGDMTAAFDAARASAAKSATPMTDVQVRIGEISKAAKLAGDDTSAFYEIVKGAKGKPDTIVTPMTQAFADYKQAVTDADTTTQIFITTMDKLAGRNVPIEDAMRTNAAAARGIGAALRKQQADAAAAQTAKDALGSGGGSAAAADKYAIATNTLAKAQAALAKLQGGTTLSQSQVTAAQDKSTIAAGRLASAEASLQKMETSGKGTAAGLAAARAKVDLAQQSATAAANKAASGGSGSTASSSAIAAAQARVDLAQQAVAKAELAAGGTKTAAALAAAQLKVADANNTLADSADAVVAADELYQKTAAMNVTVLSEQADKQHGFAYAVKVGTAEMQKQRDAFIAQQPAADIASGAAARLADHYGLIPKNVLTLLTGDPKLAVEAAKVAKDAYDKATLDRITTLKVSTSDAITDVAKYGLDLSRMPTSIVTKFNTDLATAKKEGLNLYDVYNSTARKWVAQFLTPDSAAAQITAGNVVRGYDKARGTWTANLKAIDLASPAAQAAKKHMDDVAQAKYEAKILADTSGAFTKAQNLKQAADIAAAARLLVIDGEDKATAYIQAVKAELDSIHDKTVHLTVDANGTAGATVVQSDGSFSTKGGGKGYATGGPIHGPGTGTSDSIPTWLSNGEFVNTAKDYSRNKGAIDYIHAGGTIPKMANGGLVGGPTTTIKMTGNGDISATLAAVQKIYSNADKSAAAMNAAAAAMVSMSPSGLLGSQDPSSWGWGVGKNIVPFAFHGIDFPAGVAAGTESIWSSFLSQLEPMIQGGIRPGEDWGFENRDNVNSPGNKSFHSYGLALDVNAPENGNGSAPGSGPGQIPSTAGALARQFNMLWGGDFTGTKDPMHFELHQRPGGSGGASLAGGVAAGAAPAASSGVDQWVPMMDRVIAAKGLPVAYIEPIMAAQMSHESSGNPAAINNYDINAQNGDPSKGLLQFTGATFQRYADPGYNSNIWDPESQMRAFLNYVPARYGDFSYLTKIGNGAYAAGGPVQAPGTGTSDGGLARVSNGEFVSTAADYKRNRNAINYIHSGGTIPGYAAGGPVLPSTSSLAGIPAPGQGARLSEVINALQLLTQAITDARTAATDKRALELTAWDNLNNVAQAGRDHRGNAQFNLAAAQEIKRAETRKTSAATRAADEARIESISRVNAKIAASDRLALAKANREWSMAQRTRISYDQAASAAERFQRSQQHAFQSQQSIANHLDTINNWIATNQANVANLKSNRAQVMGGISSTVSGFDSGILGHPDTRNTIANMIKGQLYDVAQAQKFNVNIVKDRKLGLSNESLQQIAAAGVDGGGVFAAAIAKGTPAQVKQLNRLAIQMHRIGDNVGATVGGAMYDNGIKVGEGMIAGLMSTQKHLEASLWKYAMGALGTMKKALKIKSPSQLFHDEVGVQIGLGVRNGINSQIPAVARASSSLVTVPHARSGGSGGSGGAPRFDVKVFIGNKEITDIARVEVEHSMTGLGHALRKVKAQG